MRRRRFGSRMAAPMDRRQLMRPWRRLTALRLTPRPAMTSCWVIAHFTFIPREPPGYQRPRMSATARILEWSAWFAGMMDAEPDDRLYDCLPMYHSVGGVVAPGSVLITGGSVVIREQSFRHPFLGRHRANRLHAVPVYRRTVPATSLRSPPQPGRSCTHRLLHLCGNGLRGDIWPTFRGCFDIPRVWNSTRRPKAAFRSTILREGLVPFGSADRHVWRRKPAARNW